MFLASLAHFFLSRPQNCVPCGNVCERDIKYATMDTGASLRSGVIFALYLAYVPSAAPASLRRAAFRGSPASKNYGLVPLRDRAFFASFLQSSIKES